MEPDRDPNASWEDAEADLTMAIQIQPTFSGNWLWRGNARFYRGFWKAGRGRDPAADLEAAEEFLARSLEVDRTHMEGWKHRGFVRWHRAAHRLAGGDRAGARDDYAAAAADFLEALSINSTLKFQIGDRADVARRKAAELE